LFTEQDALLMPKTENTWSNSDYDLSVTIKRIGDNFYLLQYGNGNNPSRYEAVFVSIENTIFLDLVPNVPDTLGDNDYRSQILPAHTFYKVKIENDSLQIAELNYGWFYKQLAKNKSLLPHAWVAGGLLLTISTKELNQFIKEHINEPGFFDDSISLISNPAAKIEKKQATAQPVENNYPKRNSQQCIPEFPHKGGWLGGDADVSVPVNDSQSLFIFGDTYIAKKNGNRQSKDLKMVSSTVAVSTCLPGGRHDIKYYWRNMNSIHPEPIFKSFTNRYNLWVNGAFIHKNSLYVLMQKSEPKKEAAANDIFNFNIIGFTLAKVENPATISPDKWNFELIPMSYFISSFSNVSALVKNEGYLYLFMEKEYKYTQLLRVDLDFIDAPKNHFEYYSLKHTWDPGINPDDMEIILSSQPGSTINYHDDIKKWVMVCGPGFMNSRIGLRTAAWLTGPWSDETVVYECPEITPGTASYKQSDFCYMGRECFQNYDKVNHTMVITYDINSSDFSAIKSNPEIYTPKVITISLTKYGIR
jgi:hypothetical protein